MTWDTQRVKDFIFTMISGVFSNLSGSMIQSCAALERMIAKEQETLSFSFKT